jgi:hypothetical protein
MNVLRQKLNDLTKEVENSYNELVEKVNHIVLYDEEKEGTENDDMLFEQEQIKLYDYQGSYYGFVLEISKDNGIYIATVENEDSRYWVKFNDIADVNNKILVIEVIENYLENN